MDNVVQNISIEDIIPSNFKPSIEEKRKIQELAVLVKQFGLLEPILVRPKNGKYEIILGMDKYQAALIANQNMVPVIIKEVDDETYSKYSNIDTNQTKSFKSLPTETFSEKETKSDIINLSELSKIKLEYERDDIKMNNGQFNNGMSNNNLGQPNMNGQNQVPTFGGRFFPSLEDEPTNMNMIGGLNVQPNVPPVPTPNNNDFNNNLIDLTDLSTTKDTPPVASVDYNTQPMNMPPLEPTTNLNLNQPQNNFEMPNLGPNPAPMNDSIINLESLQNNNPSVKPINEPVSMDILNADFGAPQSPVNQFDMGTINPTMTQPQGFNEPINPVQPDFGLNQPPMMNQQPTQMPTPQSMPSFDISQPPMPDFGTPEPSMPTPTVSTKDVTPVTNTIKNLVTSLEAFGYKINLTEEDLPNMSKLTIEVEK